MSNKIKWTYVIKDLEKQKLTIDRDEAYIIWYLDTFGYQAVIENYKHGFLFPQDKTKFANDSKISSFIEIFNFDRELSQIFLKYILNIEKRFSSAVLNHLIFNLNLRIYNTGWSQDMWKTELNWNVFLQEQNKKAITDIFCRWHLSEKEKIISFVKYLAKQQNTWATKVMGEHLNDYIKIHKITEINMKPITHLFGLIFGSTNKNLLVTDITRLHNLLKENSNAEVFNKMFNEFYDDVILKEVRNLTFYSMEKTGYNNSTSLTTLSRKWSFGVWIKVFEGLKTEIKLDIIDQVFKYVSVTHPINKIPTFISLLGMFQKVRNICSHNEVLCDFRLPRQDETLRIRNFILLNQKGKAIETIIAKNKLDLYAVAKCIQIFETNKNSKSKHDIEKDIKECFKKHINTNKLTRPSREKFINNLIFLK